MSRAEYMREWRQRRYGGTDPSTQARNKANAMAANWVRAYHPDRWDAMYAMARRYYGLPPLSRPSVGSPVPAEAHPSSGPHCLEGRSGQGGTT